MTAASPNPLVLVYTTLPDLAAAERIGAALIAARLAACVNIYPGMIALYEWNGALERAGETGMIVKTTADRRAALVEALRAAHPYEVPALIELGEVPANEAYRTWVETQTRLPGATS